MRQWFLFYGQEVGRRVDELKDVMKSGKGQDVVEMNGDGKTEVQTSYVFDSLDIFFYGSLPCVVITCRTDVES